MDIYLDKIVLPVNDHLKVKYFLPSDYVRDDYCKFCQDKMHPFIKIFNNKGEVGLVTSICKKCGAVTRTNTLSRDAFERHFKDDWLANHAGKPLEDKLILNKLCEIKHKRGGTVLDIGCGNGSYLLAFKNAGYATYGVEPSLIRSSQASKCIGSNIYNTTGEKFLQETDRQFDFIYLFDMLQFTENPIALIHLASSRLSEGGIIWWKFGKFFKRSNILQFGHYAVLQNYFNLYTLAQHLSDLGLEIIMASEEPFEIMLRKSTTAEYSNHSVKKWVISDMERYAKKSIGYWKSKIFGKNKVSYLNRNFEFRFTSENKEFECLHVFHSTEKIPVLLK